MQATACTSFSIATSTEGMPIAATARRAGYAFSRPTLPLKSSGCRKPSAAAPGVAVCGTADPRVHNVA
jgi:hypothetical protein